MYYECDYISPLPFEEVIKTVFGKPHSYTGFAVECYRKHKYIYKSYCGAIYGAERIEGGVIIKLSSVLKDVDLGRL